jgi:hypothetical protein
MAGETFRKDIAAVPDSNPRPRAGMTNQYGRIGHGCPLGDNISGNPVSNRHDDPVLIAGGQDCLPTPTTTREVSHKTAWFPGGGRPPDSQSPVPRATMPTAAALGQQIPRLLSFVLSRLKDGKTIGVVDENAPEELRRQDTVEPLYVGILLNANEAEEGHAAQFE